MIWLIIYFSINILIFILFLKSIDSNEEITIIAIINSILLGLPILIISCIEALLKYLWLKFTGDK
jgi:hypothetical protein